MNRKRTPRRLAIPRRTLYLWSSKLTTGNRSRSTGSGCDECPVCRREQIGRYLINARFPIVVKKRVTIIFLLTATAVAFYSCYLLFQPFLRALLSAVVIAIVFFPVHVRIHRRLRRPSLAALASTVIIV